MPPRPLFTSRELPVVAAPASLLPACGACGLYKTCRSPKMPPSGAGGRKILIVAEAPGAEEDKQGTQLIGESGQHLQRALKRAGVDMRRDCWMTNALICRPPKNEIPDEKMIDYCRPNLLNTIEKLKPEVIILLGGSAIQSLIGHLRRGDDVGSVTRWVGWQIPSQSLNAWVCPTYHPEYLLREASPVRDLLFQQHLDAVAGLTGRPWEEVPDYLADIELHTMPHHACPQLQRWIDSGVPIAFDYETNMLKPDSNRARIACCAVSDGKTTIAYPWLGDAVKLTGKLLAAPNPKIGFNLKFEWRWTMKMFGHGINGWDGEKGHCGMLGAHVADCRQGINSLDFQAFVHVGQEKWDHSVAPFLKSDRPGGNAENRVFQADPHALLLYCGADARLEWEVGRRQRKELFPKKGR